MSPTLFAKMQDLLEPPFDAPLPTDIPFAPVCKAAMSIRSSLMVKIIWCPRGLESRRVLMSVGLEGYIVVVVCSGASTGFLIFLLDATVGHLERSASSCSIRVVVPSV